MYKKLYIFYLISAIANNINCMETNNNEEQLQQQRRPYPREFLPHIITEKIDLFKQLIASGISVNKVDVDGSTALMCAAKLGLKDFAEFLIKNGASVNVQNNLGFTPLMYAALNGQTDMVKLLIKHEATVTLENNSGETAYTLAAMIGKEDVLDLLIDAELEDDTLDYNGCINPSELYRQILFGHIFNQISLIR